MKTASRVQINYFEKPVQIQFYEVENDRWIGGIGYKDEIICCECGQVIKLADMYEDEIIAREVNPVRLLGEWADISEYLF